MACTELLVHGFDIAAATLTPFSPPTMDSLGRSSSACSPGPLPDGTG